MVLSPFDSLTFYQEKAILYFVEKCRHFMITAKELNKIGLAGRTAKVYFAILTLGRATAIDISKKTGIKRTTIYDILLDLKNQGYTSESKRGARRVFIAEDPKMLISSFEEKLDEVKKIAPFLSAAYINAVSRPELKFYDGTNGIRHVMEEMLAMQEKEQLYWGSVSDLLDIFGNVYMTKWVKRRVRRGIKVRALISNRSRVSDFYTKTNEKFLRQSKTLLPNFVFNGLLCVFDNKVAYISSRKENFAFVVESGDLSKMIRLIFESMWTKE